MKYLLFILLAGCTKVGFRSAVNSVDPRLQPYVHAWQLNYVGGWPPGLKVQFGTIEEKKKASASCKVSKIKNEVFQGTIIVDLVKFDSSKMYQREAIVMHEMDHCTPPYRDHNDEKIEVDIVEGDITKTISCPVSWMISNLQSEGTYADCRSFLYMEMFGYQKEEEIFYPSYKLRNPAYIPSWIDRLLKWLF